MTERLNKAKGQKLIVWGGATLVIGFAIYFGRSRPSTPIKTQEKTAPTNAYLDGQNATVETLAERSAWGTQADLKSEASSRHEENLVQNADRPFVDGPACRVDADCRGPKTADCVVASCTEGKCVIDQSECGCQTSSDCDDRDPCTRDLCFARTRECVHMPQKCN